MHNLISYFFQNAKNKRDDIFACDSNKSFTYSKSESLIKNGICFFIDKGITKERVLFYADRSADTYLAI